MKIEEQEQKIILDLCEKALLAKIDIDHFYDSWPYKDDHKDVFIRQLYKDIEYGIQHTPGSFFTGKVHLDEWATNELYYLILLDKSLVEKCTDTKILFDCRNKILGSCQVGKIDIKKEAIKCLRSLQDVVD